MDAVVFSPPANLRNWKHEAQSIFDLFHRGFNMQLIYGFYVEQDECCVINMRNLKVKVTKTPHIASNSF